MKIRERVEEIEERHAFKVVSKIQGRASEHLEISSGDIEWLLNRVKKLERVITESIDVLQVVQERMEESPYKDSPAVTATSAAIRQSVYYSRKALEDE